MRRGEVEDINNSHPLMPVVLRMIDNGEKIEEESSFWQTYLLARSRGFVERTGVLKKTISLSDRGREFLDRR